MFVDVNVCSTDLDRTSTWETTRWYSLARWAVAGPAASLPSCPSQPTGSRNLSRKAGYGNGCFDA